MRILITGVGGFVGGHLVEILRSHHPNADLHGVYIAPIDDPLVAAHVLDLRDETEVRRLIGEIRPDQIYHLAGQANVRQSLDSPWDTLEHNLRPQLNLTLAALDAGISPRILVVSSGEVYDAGAAAETPFSETTALFPSNPYGVSKIAQEMLAIQYFRSHGIPFLRARPFNHFGPGQRTGFVVPDFATQIARIEAGLQPPVMRVGNLSAERDFLDVRDVVRAYVLIMAHGEPGQVYNVASGKVTTIQAILDTLMALSTVRISQEVDPARFRPNSQPRTWGDAGSLQRLTGWQPEIDLRQTLKDVLDECRARVGMSSLR
ncbi:MAG: GDP-mannose 4,6-dehydratase [Anaerolineae bacterium]|nr:GDP-mannose 4,6-dehydratase [Anaerolineae bacterium]